MKKLKMFNPNAGNLIDADPEIQERWRRYRQINSAFGDVRKAELDRMLNLIGAKVDSTILEAGTGSCYLTLPLASRLGKGGLLITADVNRQSLKELSRKVEQRRLELNLDHSVQPFHYSDDYFRERKFPDEFREKFDMIVSLATFHHFDSRAEHIRSGFSGRTNALKEFFTMLKPGGRLIIGDVAEGTRAERYFNAIDNPRHLSPLGHPHDFFSVSQFTEILKRLGFEIGTAAIEDVPWVFHSADQAMIYLNRLHNARCPAQESFDIAQKIVGFNEVGRKLELAWQLQFIEAIKP